MPDAGEAARDLADLVNERGPFLSLALTTDPSVENAQQLVDVRWRSLRQDLAAREVPEGLLEEIDAIVPEAHLRGRTVGVIGNERGVLHVEHGEDPTDPDDHADGRWASLPSLFPILAWRRWQMPHLVVLIDRRGADLAAVRRESELHREVTAQNDPQARSKPGGWSQRRYQQRAENSWEE